MSNRWPSRLWIVRHGQSAGNVARDAADAAGLGRIDIADRDMDVTTGFRFHPVEILASMGLKIGLVYALGDLPLRLFIPEGGEVMAKAWQINLIALWGWIALSASMGLFAIMRANGAMLAPMLIFASTMWLMRVPFAWALQPWQIGRAHV